MNAFVLFCLISYALATSQCGIRFTHNEFTRHARSIIGGRNVTTPTKWPWQVLLDVDGFSCGGTVINRQWVLTAAHCVYNRNSSDLFVYNAVLRNPRVQMLFSNETTLDAIAPIYNAKNNSDFQEKFKDNILTVVDIKIHAEYNGSTYVNDIALMKLETPLTFDESVAPICLPRPSQLIPTDGQAVATGFGRVEVPGTNSTTDGIVQLREVMVPILSKESCEKPIADKGALDIRRKVVCANSFAHAVHSGDSGGPLMMKASDGRWFQIGITSFMMAEEIYNESNINAFTDVRAYCDWIKENTGGETTCQEEEVTLEDVEIKI